MRFTSPHFRVSASFLTLAVALLMLPSAAAQEPPKTKDAKPAAEAAKKNSAIVPEPRGTQGSWTNMHKSFLERAKSGPVDLLFLGDSITQGWNNNAVWKRYYGERQPANFGIGGDRTQHVLWRIQNGEIEGIAPKAVVLMIGTNNMGSNSAEEIAEGVKTIVTQLREKLPKSKILLLAIFPREKNADGKTRQKVSQTNALIQSSVKDPMVHFLDIGPKFLEPDGSINKDIMPDFLHLTLKGYRIWADAIEAHLWKILEESGPVSAEKAPSGK